MPNRTIHSDGYLSWHAKNGVPEPKHFEHGTEEDIRKNLQRLSTSGWRMTAPGRLECDTNMGVLVQHIPNDYICRGTDDQGMPILEKITYQ
jgi:hypothetical protein